MRGFGAGGDGGMVGMVLKVAPVVCSFFAFVFLAVALSAGSSPNYIEGLSVINVCQTVPLSLPFSPPE